MGKVLPIHRSVTYHSATVWGKPYSSVFATYVPFSNSVGQTVNFSVRNVPTIQQQCGVNRILSVNFSVRDVPTIQQQCGANHILSVHFSVHYVQWGKPYSFSKLQCSRRTYHSATVWGKPYSSVSFSVRDVRTIQQQCGANRILSVKFCERNVCSGQLGKPFLFSKFL